MIVRPYRDGEQHLEEWSEALLLLIERRLLLEREQGRSRPGDPFAGLHLPDEAVASLLSPTGEAEASARAQVDELDSRLAAHLRRIELRVAETPAEVPLPLEEVFRSFGLDELARKILALLVAHEIYPVVHDLVGRLVHDSVAPRVTVRLALDLVSTRSRDAARLRRYFESAHPLMRFRLMEIVPQPQGQAPMPLLDQRLRAPEPLIRHVLGRGHELQTKRGQMRLEAGEVPLERLRRPASEQRVVRSWLAEPSSVATPLLALWGPPGVGKRSLLAAHTSQLACALVVVHPAPTTTARELDELLREGAREALVRGGVLYLDARAHPLLEEPPEELLGFCETYPGHLAVGSNRRWPRPAFSRPTLELGLASPGVEERITLWGDCLPADRGGATINVRELARRYAITAGAMVAATREAFDAARLQGETAQPTGRELAEACARQIATRMSSLADRVHTPADWADVVLPEETLLLLRQIPLHIKHRKQVFDTWGFGEKLASGRGLSCLFSGDPGTGKTMCAGIIARELNMELFRVDLSRTVSKYIGETEKHLAEVFEEAERAGAIILFDEADALFSKRTEVKSSVDRYANLEVNYLLQRIESYEGVTILTTNFSKSIDDAFRRRLGYKITFPFPDRTMRARLWEKMIPPRAEVDAGLDFEWLAEFELSGGNIKNVLVRAAFQAAERGSPISNEILEIAIDEEFREMGKLMHTGD